MNPDRWPEVERLYEKVMALPVDGRPAFLAEACVGDDALRREVEGLLNLETAATDFLEQPALRAAVNTLSRALPHLAPPNVPGYDIIRELGEGGMGVVYLAEQRTPLQRTVALKLIRPGMDSRQVLARFERERQALARMDHPNIAAVFDAGSTPDGRPYFVMEFVDGVPITEYCDRRNLSVRARLSLFIQICNAVQHAHQKGVIHRDLKPSNVLVIEPDGQAVPKVIDFGTAKSAEPTGAQTTLTTAGLVFGTVAYMSPEQAAFSSDIDTTTDVYSLGVLLYELLVGCTPFDRHKVQIDGLEAMLRAIRDSDPPRPSTLVTRDRDYRASIAARGTEVGLLARQLSADLDWIVLKALEKDRRRRYPTATSLGADVQRFLDSKPIEARPPSVPYRIRKFTRRYRGAVAATVGVTAALILGLVASTTLFLRAERNREEAEVRTYAATITAADAELRAGLIPEALVRLAGAAPQFRDWEWYHLLLRADGAIDGLQAASFCEWPRGNTEEMFSQHDQALKLDRSRAQLRVRGCDRLGSVDLATFTYRAEFPVPGAMILAVTENGASVTLPWRESGHWELNVTLRAGNVVRLGPFKDQPRCAAISTNGDLLAVGFPPSKFPFLQIGQEHFELWDIQRRQRVGLFEAQTTGRGVGSSTPCRVVLSDDAKKLASSANGVWVWDIATSNGRVVYELGAERGGWASAPIAFDPAGERLAIGVDEGVVDVVTLTTGRRIHLGPAGDASLNDPGQVRQRTFSFWPLAGGSVNFSQDGKRLIAGIGPEVNVWDIEKAALIRSFRGHRSPVIAAVEGPTGNRLYSQDTDGVIQAWAIAPGIPVRRVDDPMAKSVSVNQSGSAVAFVRTDSSLRVESLVGQQGFELGTLDRQVFSPAVVSPTGTDVAVMELGPSGMLLRRRNAVTREDQTVNSSNGRRPCAFDASRSALAQSTTSTELVVVSQDCVSVRDRSTLRVLASLQPGRRPMATRFTESGNLLVGVSSEGSESAILVWDWRSNRVLRSVPVRGIVRDIVTSANGSTIGALVGSWPGNEVVLWDGNLDRQLGQLQVHRAASIALNDSGTRLAIAHADNAVRIWDAKRLVQLLMLTDTDTHIGPTVFTPDGRLITTRIEGVTIWESRQPASR